MAIDEQQLARTQQSSLYASQVIQNIDGIWQKDYEIDQYQSHLSKEQIFSLVSHTLDQISDENTWMREIRILRARLMPR